MPRTPNTALPEAFYNNSDVNETAATETGAGQWGSALAYAAARFGLECKVYMVRASYDQKPYRRVMMEVWGAAVDSASGPALGAGVLGHLGGSGRVRPDPWESPMDKGDLE